jgi:hypothetical protein
MCGRRDAHTLRGPPGWQTAWLPQPEKAGLGKPSVTLRQHLRIPAEPGDPRHATTYAESQSMESSYGIDPRYKARDDFGLESIRMISGGITRARACRLLEARPDFDRSTLRKGLDA